MPRTMEVQVYQFDELSDTAKDKARDWYRGCTGQDFGAFGELFEPAETAAALLGIDFATNTVQLSNGKTRQEPDIRWSGFSSQGDGASFVGSYTFKKDCAETIRQEFGTDATLAKIADELTAFHCRYVLAHGSREWEGQITQDGRYYHKRTMDATVTDENGDELDADVCSEFLEIMRDFAQWIYDGLEREYDYCMSDENAEDNIQANEYEFTEEGERA